MPEAGEAQDAQAQQARDTAAVRQFIQRFGSLLADAGMPRMPARIFAALLTTDSSRLTAEELAGLLQVSPAAVSGGVRYLIQVGLVSRETEPGSRRHVYVLPDNVWHEVLRVRDGIMMRWADAMRGGADVLGDGHARRGAAGGVGDVLRLHQQRAACGPGPLGGLQGGAPKLTWFRAAPGPDRRSLSLAWDHGRRE